MSIARGKTHAIDIFLQIIITKSISHNQIHDSHNVIGIHCTVIGPVCIGNHVNLAQGITVTALNHNFEDATKRIDEQGVSTSPNTVY